MKMSVGQIRASKTYLISVLDPVVFFVYLHMYKIELNPIMLKRNLLQTQCEDFKAPKIFNQQNWFLHGECHKMMTVTFGLLKARQSNHQDDFGSSKWQAQIYEEKVDYASTGESEKLYNGLVDPFEPDLEHTYLHDVKRVEFVLEEGMFYFGLQDGGTRH